MYSEPGLNVLLKDFWYTKINVGLKYTLFTIIKEVVRGCISKIDLEKDRFKRKKKWVNGNK